MASQVEIDRLIRYGMPGDDGELPKGGTCGECRFCRAGCFDMVADLQERDDLNSDYGICFECGELPFVTPLEDWHEWVDCWEEAS